MCLGMSGPADRSDRAQSDRSSDQVKAKVVWCKPLTTLSPGHWLLNHQGSVLAPYGSPPTANRWPHWGGEVLPLCRGAVSVFYSPSRQSESSGRDFVGRGQHFSNRVSGISTRTMHQSTTPSLSQTIRLRWASRQFLTVPIVQTLLPVTFGNSLSSEAVVMRQLRRWKRLWQRSLTRSHKRTSMGPWKSCCFMCVLSIKVLIRKKSGNLFNDPRTLQYMESLNSVRTNE